MQNKMGVSFLYPKFLLLFLLVPVFILIHFFNVLHNRKKAVLFSNFEALEKISGVEFFSRNLIALYINIAILCLLILSVSGTNVSFNAQADTFSYVIAIDNSESMNAVDFLPNRLEAAKGYAGDFINILPIGSKIGIISFSGDGNVIHELDSSKIKVSAALDTIDFTGDYGTNLYNALVTANSIFKGGNSKSVIILSDGQFNVIDTEQVIKYAQRNQLIVNTILVGTAEGNSSDFGTILSANEESLQNLAAGTSGRFFRADDPDFSRLVRESLTLTSQQVSLDISIYLIFIAIALFLINWILYNFKFSVLP